MPTITTEIEIASSPVAVRALFLDFEGYKNWSPEWSIVAHDSNKKEPIDLAPGDRISVNLKGTSFNPVVVENSDKSFQWAGSLWGLFNGTHQFYFKPNEKTPGGTTLVHKEDFSGPLTFIVRPGWSMEKQTKANFEEFNEKIKAAVEEKAAK